MNKTKIQLFALSAIAAATLAACGGDNNTTPAVSASETTSIARLSTYNSGVYDASAAEIPAYDPISQRLFVVNAQAGAIDVLDLSDPENPVLEQTLTTNALRAGSVVNSVAVANGILAVAVEDATKTNPGLAAFYSTETLALLGSVAVGAQPDMIVFTPDGTKALTANEGEPSDNYQIDPDGSVSIIDLSTPSMPVATTASFAGFDAATLRAAGVRIYGPTNTAGGSVLEGASAAQDIEPEYITISQDNTTAFVTLQENNAIAKIDIASATVTDILPLGEKDHGIAGNEFDASDEEDGAINIRTWPGVRGLYLPDAIASYTVGGNTFLVTANEGDARAWGEDNDAYFAGDSTLGFVEEFRVKHLVNANGWAGRLNDDLPPQLNSLAQGGLLNPLVFGYCGATASSPGACRADDMLGRLNITWTMGYQKDVNGNPVLYDAATGLVSPTGTRIMYDKLYSYGGRSFSIFDSNGALVFDSGSEFERFFASDDCMVGSARNIPCKDFFNSGHDEGNALDSRSDAKGPEPEGIAVGTVGTKTYAFIGLERFGGVLIYDITNPNSPFRVDYLNTREIWDMEPEDATTPAELAAFGDLGPEGLVFIAATDSPTGEDLLVVSSEVSGTTTTYSLNLPR
ncbi:choice-of-anchor I family protein [Limnobacter alexandrii]|uniref:choice-of-anchor I family protein n=1 Tax=Limnobacter alexandrii TaxID=2570352 RepID=UPI0011096999|nr:choice-of-anchor I family protein [Limnobacter alexandrii]